MLSPAESNVPSSLGRPAWTASYDLSMSLPSERFRRGDPRPIGFEQELSPSQVARTIGVMEEIADAITMPATADEPRLAVCLTSAVLMPGLPFHLYGFSLQDVDDDGRVVTDPAQGEVRYAIVANQAADLQREAVIAFFFQLLGRQALISPAADDPELFVDLPARAAATDDERSKAAGSQLRGNWREAVMSLQAEAASAGVTFQARYQPDPFPTRHDVARRCSALRRVYNELELARTAVDRAVGVLAAAPWSIVGGEDERVRRFVQERIEAIELSRFIGQAVRDGYVCGNGYLSVAGAPAEATLRTLRPESVEIRDGRYVEHTAGGARDVTEGLVPHRAIRQLRSSYGISLLELGLDALRTWDLIQEMEQRASRLRLGGLTVPQLRELEDHEKLAARMHSDSVQRLRVLFEFFLEHLPEPPPRLYFAGQEQIS